MKTLVAVLATGIVCAGGAHAYDVAVTPAQFAALKARVAALEDFKRNCIQRHRVHLSADSAGVVHWTMATGLQAGTFYGAIVDTQQIPFACVR